MAVNNLNWAILHTERAKAKLEGRIAGFENYTLASSEVEKARQGLAVCEDLIINFKISQEQLKKLIEEVGISRTDNPARTRELMNGRRRLRLLREPSWPLSPDLRTTS